MTETFPNIDLFHVHVPKTAGTSLNANLERIYGTTFCNHDSDRLRQDPAIRVASAHTTLASARRLFPNAIFVTVLREPEARLKSTLRHLYARRRWPAYASIGPIMERLVDAQGNFVPDENLIFGTEFRDRFDNIQTRYLSTTNVHERTRPEHLHAAIEGLELFHRVLFQASFAEDCKVLLSELGHAEVQPEEKNRAKSLIPLWQALPPVLDDYLKFDRELFDMAMSFTKRGGA